MGLVTGLCLSHLGHQVINVDVDEDRIAQLQDGICHIHEQGLEKVLKSNLDAGRIRFSTELNSAVAASDIVFIAVGTPSQQDGHADLSQITEVARELAGCLDSYKLLVMKSTVPVGAINLLQSILGEDKIEGLHFDMVSNPEFLREGYGLEDFFYPDRIVVGTVSEKAKAMMRSLYQPIISGEPPWHPCGPSTEPARPVPVIETTLASAQMIKYASNAFLATRISFVNEIADLCERVGADVEEVVRGLSDDPRIGSSYFQAGLGFGGPCLEKDLRALIKIAEGDSFEPKLFQAVMDRNDSQIGNVIAKLKQLIDGGLQGRTVAVFGLAFKAGTNDVRNSLAIKVTEQLEQEGAVIKAHDPVANQEARSIKPHLNICDDPYQAVQGADGLLILTEWPSFKDLDFRRIKSAMRSPNIVDGRNLLDPQLLAGLGFSYLGVGRP